VIGVGAKVTAPLRLQCVVLAEIVRKNEGAHIAMTGRDVQNIGKTTNKTTDRQSRNVRLFILPSSAGTKRLQSRTKFRNIVILVG
jgi:hypothetical protein